MIIDSMIKGQKVSVKKINELKNEMQYPKAKKEARATDNAGGSSKLTQQDKENTLQIFEMFGG